AIMAELRSGIDRNTRMREAILLLGNNDSHLSSGPMVAVAASTASDSASAAEETVDRKSTRLNSSHVKLSYAVFCLKKKTILAFAIFRAVESSGLRKNHFTILEKNTRATAASSAGYMSSAGLVSDISAMRLLSG